jgi:hypothetical protein
MKEAAIVTGLDVYGVENVQEVIDFRRKRKFRTSLPSILEPSL